jgi:GTP-binding protein HflX
MKELIETAVKPERSLAVTFIKKGESRDDAFEYLDELCELAKTAGADVIDKHYQELPKPNRAFLIGTGKVAEIKEEIDANNIELVLFDVDLSPMQMRNLEREFGIRVMDRSGLILSIFAKRAKSLEAKTQVSLAQNQYLLPRLTRMWTHLSKQQGGVGVGMKGPGETQIETDRRLLRDRVMYLKEKLKEIETVRETQSKSRSAFPRFALVGYTNSGKSTLMNAITNSDVYIEDELFATLDTTVRSFELPGGTKAILSDTVGFIRKLPHHLVASFRSTLAEASDADVLVHVVDVSNPNFRSQIKVVEETLASLKITDIPVLLAFNKIDVMDEQLEIPGIREEYGDSVFISAKRNINMQALLDRFKAIYDANTKDYEILLPYSDMGKLNQLYKVGEILDQTDNDDGSIYKIRIKPEMNELFNNLFGQYIV